MANHSSRGPYPVPTGVPRGGCVAFMNAASLPRATSHRRQVRPCRHWLVWPPLDAARVLLAAAAVGAAAAPAQRTGRGPADRALLSERLLWQYVVGRRERAKEKAVQQAADAKAATRDDLCQRYAEACKEEAHAILEAEVTKALQQQEVDARAEKGARKEAKAAARASMSAAQLRLDDHNAEAAKLSAHLMLVQGSRVGLKKFTSKPDPAWAMAVPSSK
eukprot:2402337-Prymnesium_polylepis.1